MLIKHIPVETPEQATAWMAAEDKFGSKLPEMLLAMLVKLLGDEPGRPFNWNGTLLPPGTVVLAKLRDGTRAEAVVRDDGQLVHDGVATTPSSFANAVAKTPRNAWTFLLVKRPGDADYRLANELRATAPVMRR